MPRPDDLGSLEGAEFKELEQIEERFSRAWESSPGRVRIEDFLPSGPPRFRLAVLCELIKADLEKRWRQGQQILLEEYLKRFAELNQGHDLSRLIFEEFRIRHRLGKKPALGDFQQRFPAQFDAFQRIVQKEKLPLTDGRNDATSVEEGSDGAKRRVFQPGDLLDKRYVLKKILGEGTFGQVWRAEEADGDQVAIKIPFKPLSHKETEDEMRSLTRISTLEHPYLLDTRTFWVEKGYLFIVMELADGTLRDCLKEHKELGQKGIPIEELLPYFQCAAEALDYLHSKKMVHRDIKPHNILLVGGKAKLADFGLTRQLRHDASMTQTEGGTIAYMPPEMFEGKAYQSSDQYCLAVTYIEMRQGRLPFRGSIAELVRRDNPDMQDLDPGEKAVLEVALSRDPKQRYASCSDMMRELTQAVKKANEFMSERTGVKVPAIAPNLATPTGTLPPQPLLGTNAPEGAQNTNRPDSRQTVNGTIGGAPDRTGSGGKAESPRAWKAEPSPKPWNAPAPLQPGQQLSPDAAQGTIGGPVVIPQPDPPPADLAAGNQRPPGDWNQARPAERHSQPKRSVMSRVMWLAPLVVLAGLAGSWYVLHLGAQNEVRDLLRSGEAASFAAALARVNSNWFIPPSRQELHDEVRQQWWSMLDTVPGESDMTMPALQKRHADLAAFRQAFPESDSCKERLQINEKVIAHQVAAYIKNGELPKAELALKEVAWTDESLARDLLCQLDDRKQGEEIAHLASSNDFAGALRRLSSLSWCKQDSSATARAHIAENWLSKIEKSPRADTLSGLTAQQRELLAFQEAFPKNDRLPTLLVNHDQALAGQVDMGLGDGTVSLAQAIEAARLLHNPRLSEKVEQAAFLRAKMLPRFEDILSAATLFRDAKLAQTLRDIVKIQWLTKFDLVDGKDYPLPVLKQLAAEINDYERHFPQRNVDAQRLKIAAAIKNIVEIDGLLATADKLLTDRDFAGSLSFLKRINKDSQQKNRLWQQAETGLFDAMQAFVKDRKYDKLEADLETLEKNKISFADEKWQTRLPFFWLEAAWSPFLTGQVDTKKMRAGLKKFESMKLTGANLATYKALNGMLKVYDNFLPADSLIGLASAKADGNYHRNLMLCLAQLESSKGSLAFDDLVKLGEAARKTDQAGFQQLLDVSLKRLIEKSGWMPATPNEWKACRKFCEGVDKPSAWVKTLRAECLIMLEDDGKAKAAPEFAPGWYGAYVHALVLDSQKKYSEAADLLCKEKNLPDVLKPLARLKRAEDLLSNAIEKLPRTGPKREFQNAQDAVRAKEWQAMSLRLRKGAERSVSQGPGQGQLQKKLTIEN